MSWNKKIHIKSSLKPKDSQYAMFIGRWQPLHIAHQLMFEQAMNEGKKILICIRDIQPDEKNPFTAKEVRENIKKHYKYFIKKKSIKVIIVPDICSVEFGRGVGYDIIERIPPSEIASISATKIRKQMKQKHK